MDNTKHNRPIKRFLLSISTFGDTLGDCEDVKLQHGFLIYMGILMGCGGIIWGSIALYYNLIKPATIPYSYTLFTTLNFIYFYYSKRFKVVRFFQVSMSLLLPFFFQWSLGGFVPSGAVMLWSMLALIGSLTFQDSKSTIGWLVAYITLTMISGLINGQVAQYSVHPPQLTITLFFVINICIISAIVFGLNIYFVDEQKKVKKLLLNRRKGPPNSRFNLQNIFHRKCITRFLSGKRK